MGCSKKFESTFISTVCHVYECESKMCRDVMVSKTDMIQKYSLSVKSSVGGDEELQHKCPEEFSILSRPT